MSDSVYVLDFGEFKGKGIEELSDEYIKWAIKKDGIKRLYPEFCKVGKKELEHRKKTNSHII